jgi:ketosteroid isomerase-like protein
MSVIPQFYTSHGYCKLFVMKTLLLMSLLSSMVALATAQSADVKEVSEAVEKLRMAMVNGDKNSLSEVTSDALSYGHSSGRVEDKTSFVQTLSTGQSDFVSITLSEQTVNVSGNTAIVRHKLNAETNDNGKPGTVNLGVLLVWQKQKGKWMLLARQAFKL